LPPAPHERRTGMSGTTTTQRTVRLWAGVLLAVAIAAAALLAVLGGGAAGAQAARGVNLDVDKTVSPRTVQVGERQVFTVRITNRGSARAREVRMRDPLPSAVRFIRAETSRHVPGSCGIADRVVRCRLGTLRPHRAVTVKIHVRPVVAGSYVNRAFASFGNSASRTSGLSADESSDAARAQVAE
jgi:uncharacterized repeat protein (TIGR01451 family)